MTDRKARGSLSSPGWGPKFYLPHGKALDLWEHSQQFLWALGKRLLLLTGHLPLEHGLDQDQNAKSSQSSSRAGRKGNQGILWAYSL